VSIQTVLLPVFIEVGLIFAICGWMIYAINSMLGGGGRNPAREKIARASFANQFEMPVLFFALVPLAILTRAADGLFVALSWVFVVSRIGHAAVHLTSNRQPARGLLWLAGVVVLLVLWLSFAGSVLFPQASP
jgi:hypothetical protein